MNLTDDEIAAFLHKWKAYIPDPGIYTKERLQAAGKTEFIRQMAKMESTPRHNMTKEQYMNYIGSMRKSGSRKV
jgi:hypothetical protein